MDFSNQSDRIKRYAVALQGAARKTVNVKLNNDAPTKITAMQVDRQSNVLITKVLQAQESDASFDFDDDGELWLVEGTEIPPIEQLSSSASNSEASNVQIEILENLITDRDVSSNQKPTQQPGEA
ncbi:MAG: hypothetical protein ACK4TA_11195 [Saprospiraceae bacterium]